MANARSSSTTTEYKGYFPPPKPETKVVQGDVPLDVRAESDKNRKTLKLTWDDLLTGLLKKFNEDQRK